MNARVRRVSNVIRSHYPMVLCSTCIAAELKLTEAEVRDTLPSLLSAARGIRNTQWGHFTVRCRLCHEWWVIT